MKVITIPPTKGWSTTRFLEMNLPKGPKKRVLGLRVGGQAKAYPFKDLADSPVVNDAIQGYPVVVWFDPETETGLAYGRIVGEEILTFVVDPNDPDFLIDQKSGSRWSIATGLAVAGQLRGEQLPPLVVTPSFEFGWFAYFPDSEIYLP